MDRPNDTSIRSMALAAGLVLSLAACGRTEAPAEAPETPAPVAAPPAPASIELPAAQPSAAVAEPESPAEIPVVAPAPAPVVAATPPVKAAPPAPPAPAEKPAAFASCGGCHSVDQGGRNGIGPNLFGVMGRPMGSKAGFAYSDAMAANGQVWTPALMDAFLAGPRDVVPGTKMMAAPVRSAEARQALIAYLSSLE